MNIEKVPVDYYFSNLVIENSLQVVFVTINV